MVLTFPFRLEAEPLLYLEIFRLATDNCCRFWFAVGVRIR
jgi:hypothetical protein